MKKEIGGYLDYEENQGKAYYEDLIELNNGRNGLRYLIRSKQIKKLYLPTFLCDAVFEAVKKEGIIFEEYAIQENFRPIINENEIKEKDYLYIVNYYGQLTNESIINLKEKYKNIIVDNTQAFFQEPVNDVDTIYTCRKYFGVPDGGYLFTDTYLDKKLKQDYSYKRMEHLLGRYEKNASDFYEKYQENDAFFDHEEIKTMSKLTKNILKGIDYNNVIKARNTNYNYLDKHLRKINQLNLIKPTGPFSYPLYIENGNELRAELIKNKIYVPVLWPNVLEHSKESIEYQYTKNILPLPIDQRYGIKEMKYIIKVIKKF